MRIAAELHWIELGPEIQARMTLEPEPQAATVLHYVMGRGARRAWDAINRQMTQPRGAVFWIGGEPGCGKTHFLNYVSALSRRAGSLLPESKRDLTVAIEFSGPLKEGELEHRIIAALAAELSGEQRLESNLWRELGGIDALAVAFEQARRQGVQALSIMVDFGTAHPIPALTRLPELDHLARNMKGLRLVIVAAARGVAPPGIQSFEVGPEDEQERVAAAIGRARHIREEGRRPAREAYRGVTAYDSSHVFPLHPETLEIIRLFAQNTDPVATMAAMVRECIVAWQMRGQPQLLVYPAELMECAQIRGRIDTRLGETGRAALKIAHAAADLMDKRVLARQLVDTLALHYLLSREAPLELSVIRTLVPELRSHAESIALEPLLAAMSAATGAVVQYNASRNTVRFNPNAGGAHEVAAFNNALPLMRHFDSSLSEVSDAAEIKTRLRQLGIAMADALEAAHRERDVLESAMLENGEKLGPQQERVLADFIALAEAGAESLLEAANDERREAAERTLDSYHELAAVAGAAPRLRQMRDYLVATGLPGLNDDAPNRDLVLIDLGIRANALLTEAQPLMCRARPRQLELLDHKFRQFKAEYIRLYCAAHEQWRADLMKALATAEDLRRHLEALRLLNMISVLGEPQGLELFSRVQMLEPSLIRCEPVSPMALEASPRCSRCGFVLGKIAPNAELSELMEHTRRLLRSRLVALSQSTIARLIREHDYSHRLDGFLKIVQAAQTDALIDVLDERLVRYLGRLLDDNRASTQNARTVSKLPSRLSRSREKLSRAHGERAAKGEP